MSFTAEYQAALAPWQTPSLTIFSSVIGGMFEQVYALVQDVGAAGDPGYVPGWSVLFDPDACPYAYLPYLAQFVGVQIPAGTDEPTARLLIKAEAGTARGTLAAVRSAVQRNLTGTQSVFIKERLRVDGTPDAYQLVIITKPAETPALSVLQAAVNLVKPVGILVNYIQSDGWTWAGAIHTWAADTFSWDSTAGANQP